MMAAPNVNPPPNAASPKHCPGDVSNNSASASGIVELELLPQWRMLLKTGAAVRFATASRMRWLA